MKKMDYVIGGAGATRTFTLVSDRPTKRTPQPVSFDDAVSARKFLKAAQVEGFRFSGAELVDPEQRLVKNGYFVKADSGQLTPAGQDWGPLDTVYEVGDAMLGGPRNGKEAVIEEIIKGDFAKKMGFGIVFLLRERDVSNAN